MFKKGIFVLILLFCASFSEGQSTILKEADKLFEGGNYSGALALYNRYDRINKNGRALLYRGISQYFLNDPKASLADFKKSHALKNDNPINYLYSAKCFYAMGEYKEAALFYKNFLRKIPSDSPDIMSVVEEIKRCEYNLKALKIEQKAFVENMGPSVNTAYDELLPRQSPNQPSKYYFSSNRDIATGGKRDASGLKDDLFGNYCTDMYAVELINGNWTQVFTFNSIQNTSKNEILQGFNNDGNVMYFLKSLDQKQGNLYADTFSLDASKRAFPNKVFSPFVPEIGDKDLLIYNDSTWLFSSKRNGGFGGYDIYIATKTNGIWNEALNLGEKINTKYNEKSPYLTKGAHILSYSSDRLEGLGGYDIYTAEYSFKSNEWLAVKNMGGPINSSGDDLGFFISSDGTQAVFSSDRINGLGGSDLYIAYLKDQMIDQLSFVDVIPFAQNYDEIGLASIEGIVADSLMVKVNENTTPETKTTPTTAEPTRPASEYINYPLYYTAEDDLLSSQNRVILSHAKDLLQIFPDSKLVLTSHSNVQNQKDFSLFFSVKRGEKIVDYMQSIGIDRDRFIIKGCGFNFPVANPTDSRIANKLNNRIDIDFINIDPKRIKILDEYPVVNKTIEIDRFPKYLKAMRGLMYTIKVAETNQMYKHDIINQNEDVFIIKNNSGSYQYYIGLFSNYNEARGLKNAMLRENIIDANITPFVDGLFVDENEINLHLPNHPDLAEYLKYETD